MSRCRHVETVISGEAGAELVSCIGCGEVMGRTDPILWMIVCHADYPELALRAAFKRLLLGPGSQK